ncbi:hypothetical protein JOF53_007608 [Crossiella equi]|uniref:Uncharacterized protein n=1 Tax=Crossiella equi TaxID=130796 RepID=A0ABS5AQ95_9PSEU|nr:hypothetical protein [Crossiella equi]MBP2478736.1 hypothetical protein [Crossiella equi]
MCLAAKLLFEWLGPRGFLPRYLGEVPLEILFTACTLRLVALLPDGRYRWRGERVLVHLPWLLLALPLATLAAGRPLLGLIAEDTVPRLTAQSAVLLLAVRCFALEPAARRQLRWVLVTGAALVLGFFLVSLGHLGGLAPVPSASALSLLVDAVPATVAPIAVSATLFRHVVLRRSLLYGLLWLEIGVLYLAATALLDTATAERFWVGMAAIAVAAATCAAGPLRRVLTRFADGPEPVAVEFARGPGEGLAEELASVLAKVRLARTQLDDESAAKETLTEVHLDTQRVIEEVRALARGLAEPR